MKNIVSICLLLFLFCGTISAQSNEGALAVLAELEALNDMLDEMEEMSDEEVKEELDIAMKQAKENPQYKEKVLAAEKEYMNQNFSICTNVYGGEDWNDATDPDDYKDCIHESLIQGFQNKIQQNEIILEHQYEIKDYLIQKIKNIPVGKISDHSLLLREMSEINIDPQPKQTTINTSLKKVEKNRAKVGIFTSSEISKLPSSGSESFFQQIIRFFQRFF